LVGALVSLITNASPVEVLVRINPVAEPLLVKVNEVGVSSPAPKVKSMFLPVVVVIAFPVLYAACKPNGAPLQETTLLLLSKQIALPTAVPIPVIVR